MGGFESEFEANRSCSWNWSWVTAIGMKRGRCGRNGEQCGSVIWMHNVSSRLVPGAALLCVQEAQDAAVHPCHACFGFIFMRRVFVHVLLDFCSVFCRRFSVPFCRFLCAYCICLDSFGSHKNKLPEVCKCMMQLIRYCLRAWICHGDWLQLCVPKACARPEWGAACTCHSFALQKASPVNKSKRRQRITLRDTCTELNCQLQFFQNHCVPKLNYIFTRLYAKKPSKRQKPDSSWDKN